MLPSGQIVRTSQIVVSACQSRSLFKAGSRLHRTYQSSLARSISFSQCCSYLSTMNLVSKDVILTLMCLIVNCELTKSKSELNKATSVQISTGEENRGSGSAEKTGSSAKTTVPAESKECVVIVIETIDGEQKLMAYNATRIEVEREGKEFFDEICEDDPDWNRALSQNSLCSLVEAGISCYSGKKSESFKDKVKKIT